MAVSTSAAAEGGRKRSRDKVPSGSSGDGGFATHSHSELESRDGGPARHTRRKAEPPDLPDTGRELHSTKSLKEDVINSDCSRNLTGRARIQPV